VITVLQSILAFVVAIGVLITFHEFGHFWVARRCNVRILRFSVGFGRPIWKREFGSDRSEFVIAALPLGGYVRMLDEREGDVPAADAHRAFNRKPLAQRTAIVAAGPVFNFLFAALAYWIIFMVGITGLKPIVGEVVPGSPAEQAGFRIGDEILRIDDAATGTWISVANIAVNAVVKGGAINFVVRGREGGERVLELDLSRISIDDMAGGQLLQQIGVEPERPVIPALIGDIVPGGAAETAGMRSGDRVIRADGADVRDWEHWVEIVRAHPGRTLAVEIERDGARVALVLTPEPVIDDNGRSIGRIGAAVAAAALDIEALVGRDRYGPVDAFARGWIRTWDMSVLTLRVLGKMIVGEASVRNLSGPISIAQYAGESAGVGIVAFLGFLAIVSVSLGVLNLLPIPLLDGGHLMYYLMELVKGSPVSESTQIVGQHVGLAMLLGLMGLAFYNDILRLLG
jgi:regulator of sigma E protease